MNLEENFKKLEEGQKQILLMVSGMQNKASKTNAIYSIDDMANMFNVSLRTIYNWMGQCRFGYVKVGSKTYVTERQLEEFLSNHQVNAPKSWRA